jgi:hypothetical protein
MPLIYKAQRIGNEYQLKKLKMCNLFHLKNLPVQDLFSLKLFFVP